MLFGLLATVASAKGLMNFEEWHELYKDLRTERSKLKTLEERMETFEANVLKVKEHNAKKLSWTMGLNHFADLSEDEWAEEMGFNLCAEGMKKTLKKREADMSQRLPAVPHPLNAASIDWVDQGAVTPVKNQGGCGSCWAFSTTGSVEGAWKQAGNGLVSLSEQQLVSCDHNGDQGCSGGLMDNAFGYIKSNGGINTEDNYPYTSSSGTAASCDTALESNHVAQVSSWTDVTRDDEDAMINALNQGPVSVAIEADTGKFQLYENGILTDPDNLCGDQLDHGVLAVGYGEENGVEYWKVKNSWGGTWGDEGYIRMGRGSSAPTSNNHGTCGILMSASFPIA